MHAIKTSVSIPSSTKVRLQYLTRRIHGLGELVLFELLAEAIATSSGIFDPVEVYAAIDGGILDRFDGRDLPPQIWRVK
jgi:hypothetical protein